MALLGVKGVAADGTQAGPRRAVIRTLAFPLSFLLLGLGFTGILFQRDRRALQDMIAGTAVVYAWDAHAARLRYLDRPPPDHVLVDGASLNGASPDPASLDPASRDPASPDPAPRDPNIPADLA